MTDTPERLVVVYGEATRRGHGRRHERRQLVFWTALRVASGETFECFIDTPASHRPTIHHLHHMRIDAGALDEARPIDDVRARWREFCRDGDVVVAWNKSTLELHDRAFGSRDGSIVLKGVYCRRRRGRCGLLDDVVAREGLSTVPLGVRGRAGQRLANVAAGVVVMKMGAATAVPKEIIAAAAAGGVALERW